MEGKEGLQKSDFFGLRLLHTSKASSDLSFLGSVFSFFLDFRSEFFPKAQFFGLSFFRSAQKKSLNYKFTFGGRVSGHNTDLQ